MPVISSGPADRMRLEKLYANPPTGFPAASTLSGQIRHFQGWFRDAPGLSGHFNLSDAITVTFWR
ncbi:MAG: hypothetical protein ABGY71_01140 [bacterium]|nr:hypothetical protein [Planctomycetota bacterium]HIL51786.1 hypothetical protein [Planctomycetota bacterium]